ncbi:MAG: efflux RND transporter periplasmic adaptor subunit, partial [Rhodospirillales bacterium]|nr:efflux RND transporter periplasmic adaptor subunit [Rhodospirillales bacterium]
FLLPLVLLAGCKERGPAGPLASGPPAVKVITLRSEPVVRTTELPGRTNAVMTSDVRPQVSGVILKRLFTEGSEVTEGQPLYQIDPATYQVSYESALATLAHDQAALATAKAKAARYKPLAAAQAVSTQDYDDAVAAEKEAVADIASARASVEQARINLVYTKVLAPISGHIGRSSVTPGALVTADQTNALATVTQLDPIYVDLNQPATALLRFRKELSNGELERVGGSAAKVTLKLEGGSTYPIAGELQFSEVTVDQGTGTVLLRAIFPNPDHMLLPGMSVHAVLQEGVNRNGILVPQGAVSRNVRGDATVLLLGKDNKAELRVIQTGPAVGADWVVTGGLKPGEHLIVEGLQGVRPAMAVRPAVDHTSAAASGTQEAAGGGASGPPGTEATANLSPSHPPPSGRSPAGHSPSGNSPSGQAAPSAAK